MTKVSQATHHRNVLAMIHDIAAGVFAWMVAYWLRFNMDIPAYYLQGMLQLLAVVVSLQAIVFWKFGLYRGMWRYASLSDLKRILFAVGLSALFLVMFVFMGKWQDGVPRSVLILNPVLLVLTMGGSRFAYRAWKEHRLYGDMRTRGEPALVLGAGDTAVNLLKEASRRDEWHVVGLLDDDPSKLGRVVDSVRVLGRLDEVALWATRLQVKHAIVALPAASARTRRRVVELATSAGLTVLTVPSYDDLLSGRVTTSQVRRVELDDLLGREPVVLDTVGLHALLAGQSVLVTGAGGSIGSELCRQIAKFAPGKLVLFELSEYALYQIEQEFREQFPHIPIACVVGDVKHALRVDAVLATHQPRIIFHAAAYKHVPLMESDNAWEAVRNNVGGTRVLGDAALRYGVDKFVLISTDKAVSPTNVMGASKRLAEMICQGLEAQGSTQFVLVRFGNVLGSTGSVIPKFHRQIAQGGPITVTHPEVTRYFMSIPEAAQLVLQAALMGRGGEIFVLEMGEPVRIVDLARDMIRLSGLDEDDIKIVFTGLRPGEKLYEELLADGEATLPTLHPKLRIAKPRELPGNFICDLDVLMTQDRQPGEQETRDVLLRWVTDYRPNRQQEKGDSGSDPRSARSEEEEGSSGATAMVGGQGR